MITRITARLHQLWDDSAHLLLGRPLLPWPYHWRSGELLLVLWLLGVINTSPAPEFVAGPVLRVLFFSGTYVLSNVLLARILWLVLRRMVNGLPWLACLTVLVMASLPDALMPLLLQLGSAGAKVGALLSLYCLFAILRGMRQLTGAPWLWLTLLGAAGWLSSQTVFILSLHTGVTLGWIHPPAH